MPTTLIPSAAPWVAPAGRVALAASACGLLAPVPVLPPALRALLLAAFVLAGPGVAVLLWVAPLPPKASFLLAPVLGLAVTILTTTAAAFFWLWHPLAVLAVLAAATAAATLVAGRPHGGPVSPSSEGGA